MSGRADSNASKASEARGSRRVGYRPEPTPMGGQDADTTGTGLPWNAACFFCGDPVDPTSRQTWHRVIGRERKAVDPSRRSGSDVALREPCEGWAHDLCVRRAQAGVAPLQESLL